MKKLIMIFALAVLILAFGSRTQAGTTYVNVVDASDEQPDTWFLPLGGDPWGDDYYRWHDEDWGWTHTFSPPEFPDVTINWATLGVYAFDADPIEVDLIEGDGVSLGQLDISTTCSWHLTTFTLNSLALDELLDGTLNIWMDIDAEHPGPQGPSWAVTLGSSTLTIDYDVILLPDPPVDPDPPVIPDPPDKPNPPNDPPIPPNQTIPAPGAILLGSIGVGIVGWLRRRRAI